MKVESPKAVAVEEVKETPKPIEEKREGDVKVQVVGKIDLDKIN